MAAQHINIRETVVVMHCLLALLSVCVSINYQTSICGHDTSTLFVQNTTFFICFINWYCYKPPSQACDDDTSLPDALNHFYSWFEMQNDTPAQKLPTPPNDQAMKGRPYLGLTHARLRVLTTYLAVYWTADRCPNRYLQHLAEPGSHPPHVSNPQQSYRYQRNHLSCLNDYRPIALTSIIMKCFERLVFLWLSGRANVVGLIPREHTYWHKMYSLCAL